MFQGHQEIQCEPGQACFAGVFCEENMAKLVAEEMTENGDQKITVRKRTVTVDGKKVTLYFAVQDHGVK